MDARRIRFLEYGGIAFAIAGIIRGVVVASTRETFTIGTGGPDGWSSSTTTYPQLRAGIAWMIVTVLIGVGIWCLARMQRRRVSGGSEI